jgi:hypothetical protein
MDTLYVVVYYTAFVEKFDPRQEEAEPFASFGLVDFDWDQRWQVRPAKVTVSHQDELGRDRGRMDASNGRRSHSEERANGSEHSHCDQRV